MHVFLTGATGLLGRYVLREFLRHGIPTIALARTKRPGTGVTIDQALSTLEMQGLLPRPTIVEGDLTLAQLGLRDSDYQMLEGLNLVVVHCGASIRFIADRQRSEPYATNVQGTQNLLEFCQRIGAQGFVHVSTAYVQSQRSITPVAYEQAVDISYPAGNDYEKSKIEAECRVLECGWLPWRTILRPSIIVGDSQTGYTSTFNGFYSPLQIANEILRKSEFGENLGVLFRQKLGLEEQDSKNLVPVDWVAAAVAHIAMQPQVNRILHLTNPVPVPVLEIQHAIQDALLEKHGNQFRGLQAQAIGEPEQSAEFRAQMNTYEAYFGDDPIFDRSCSNQALASLPCPRVDYALLLKLARFALDTSFGWPRVSWEPARGVEMVSRLLDGVHSQSNVGSSDECWRLDLLGPGAPAPLYFCKLNNRWHASTALVEPKRTTLRMVVALDVFTDCITGKIDPIQCLADGRWVIHNFALTNWLAEFNEWIQDVKLGVFPH